MLAGAASGRFEHERFGPSPALEPFVAHYWAVRWDLRGQPPRVVETLPHPCVHIVFERGTAQVAGVPTRIFRRELYGEDRVFGIKFRPAAFRPLLGAPLSRITDRVVELDAVLGDSSGAARAILSEPEPRASVLLAEELLRLRLPAMPPAIAAMRDLVERLATDPSITRVEQAAALAGMEIRQLQRHFRDAVGVSPKRVIRRYRMHEAAARLAGAEAPELAALAIELGYYDQAHFARDFKAIVGCSPGDYLAKGRGDEASGQRGS